MTKPQTNSLIKFAPLAPTSSCTCHGKRDASKVSQADQDQYRGSLAQFFDIMSLQMNDVEKDTTKLSKGFQNLLPLFSFDPKRNETTQLPSKDKYQPYARDYNYQDGVEKQIEDLKDLEKLFSKLVCPNCGKERAEYYEWVRLAPTHLRKFVLGMADHLRTLGEALGQMYTFLHHFASLLPAQK